MLKCSQCGSQNPADKKFCSQCGKPLLSPQVPACSTGTGIPPTPVSPAPKKSGPGSFLIIGGILFLLVIFALGFFVVLPLLGDESPSFQDLGYSPAGGSDDSDLATAPGSSGAGSGGRIAASAGSALRVVSGTPVQTPAPATCDPAAEELYYVTQSNTAVQNNPAKPRIITIGSAVFVTRIMTYHYNSAGGAVPGTIGLMDENGKMYGPWQAVDDSGKTGTSSIHWSVKINQFIPAGTYTVFDSDPSTWSTNDEVGNAGVVWVYISKKCTATQVQTTSAPSVQAPSGTPVQVAAGQVVHGTITTGTPVVAVQGSVPASGGTITVVKPGLLIDGLKFVAPAGAYPAGQQITISSSPVSGNTFGSYFNPATPMIEINAGNVFAEEPVQVTIPVTIPDDQFAMAFYYDDASKKLEGVPAVSQDSKSITIATRHFSNILVSLINKDTLDGIKTADSGFRPGIDDWEFTNRGSYVANGGFCSGQSGTMMWYYTEQVQKAHAPRLFNRFDNNGRDPVMTPGAMVTSTAPAQGTDDTLGQRFASVIQEKTNSGETYYKFGKFIADITSDVSTFREFKYSILLTGEPQYMSVYPGTGVISHAIVCYKVYDNTLWVADPNYPGKERMIVLKGDTLTPYSWGENSQETEQDAKNAGHTFFPEIKYVAKTAMFPWPLLAAEYAKFPDGTIGDDMFPPYKLYIDVTNDDGTTQSIAMDGGKNKEQKQIIVRGHSIFLRQQAISHQPGWESKNLTGAVFSRNFAKISQPMTLAEGSNVIGVYGHGVSEGWLGFDWIDINYKPTVAVTTPATTAAPPGQHYTATRYALLDSASYDPACTGEVYETLGKDPYCDTKPSYSSSTVMCGKPPGQCINSTWNNGIHGVYSYYYGGMTKTMSQVRWKDGDEYYYAQDGTIVSRVTYKNDTFVRTVI